MLGVEILLPSGSEQHEVLLFFEYLRRNTSGSSLTCADRKDTLKCWYSWVVKIRNTSEAVFMPQYTPWPSY